MEDNKDLTLIPTYRFEWEDGTVRETSDPDFTNSPHDIHPDAVEALAAMGRDDPECTVELIGMSG